MFKDPDNTGQPPDRSGDSLDASSTAYFAKQPMPDVPSSKPLQWFLLVAMIVTGAAYVVGEWNEITASQTKVKRGIRLRRMVESQDEYLAHTKNGDEAYANKRFDQAVSEYRQALQHQNTVDGHENLGRALLKQGNPDAAFAQFRETLRFDPARVTAASAWGMALADQGKPDEAVRVLQSAVDRNPDSGLLHYNLATTLLQMRINIEGQRRMAADADNAKGVQAAEARSKALATEALRHFTAASRNKIDSPVFWCAYGQLRNEMGQYPEAEICLLRATSEDPKMAAAQFQLALTENHLGKYADAITHYNKVLVLTPDDTVTLNDLALLYATATNSEVRSPKMAVQLATRACDATTQQNARYLDTLARSCAADGDFFKAIAWEDKAIHRATQLGDVDLAQELQARQALFTEHKLPEPTGQP